MTLLQVGDPAPLFSAPGTGGRSYDLADYKGKIVVLVFYPGDATPVCTDQLNAYNDHLNALKDLNSEVLALSPQDVESHEKFREDHDFQFPLLYDKGKEIGEMYGVVGPLGFYRRSVFVVNSDGKLTYVNRAMAGLSYPSADEISKAVKKAA